MSVKCSDCNTSNIDGSHYCAKCGHTLERNILGKEKKYVVVPEGEYENLKKDNASLRRDVSRLNRRVSELEESWFNGAKIIASIKDFYYRIEDGLWAVLIWAAIIAVGIFVYFANNKSTRSLEIVHDEKSAKYGLYNHKSDTYVLDYDYNKIELKRGEGFYFYYLYADSGIGVADSTGRITIRCDLDSARAASNLVRLYSRGRQGVMDLYGNKILPCEYSQVLGDGAYLKTVSSIGNILPVKEVGKSDWTLLDREGRQLSSARYKNIRYVPGRPDLLYVDNGENNKGLVNDKGVTLIKPMYDYIGEVSDNRIWARLNPSGPWYLFKSDGDCKNYIKKDYTLAQPYKFSEGLTAIVRISDNKLGYVDTLCDLKIPLEYELAPNQSPAFKDGKAVVSYNGNVVTIDKDGQIVK